MPGSQGGIKPGNRVGGKEGHRERRRTFARRRWKNKAGRDGASQRVGGQDGRRSCQIGALLRVSPNTEFHGGLEGNSPRWRVRPALSDALSCTEERMGPFWFP